MAALGIRCSNTDYAYAVLDGTRDVPILVAHGRVPVPKGFGRVDAVTWMMQEVQGLLDRHEPSTISIRASESRNAGKALEHRLELETAVLAAAGSRGLKAVFKKRRNTIAKDLGLKGRARYLVAFDTSPLTEFEDLPQKEQDAVLMAWSSV